VTLHTPILRGVTRPLDEKSVHASCGGDSLHLVARSETFEPPRSPLIAWTLRMASVADRLFWRTFSSGQAATSRRKGLVGKALDGLGRRCGLLSLQEASVTFERARWDVWQVREARRERYRRYEQLRESMDFDDLNPANSQLYLNPVNRWVRLPQAPSDDASPRPSESVLFFLIDNQVQGLRMSLEGQALINELADYQPCTVVQWARLSRLADAAQLVTLAQYLARSGLVAWQGPRG